MEKEIWRPIKGYEGLYEASNLGNVRSVDRVIVYSNGRKHFLKGKILKPVKNQEGYLFLWLFKDSKRKTFKVHRIIMNTFVPNPSNLPQINHKDEDKTNNCVDNLEWCDAKYNINYGTRTEKVAIKKSKSVLQIDANTEKIIAEYSSATEAGMNFCFGQRNISNCCLGKRKTAYGFKWKYKG